MSKPLQPLTGLPSCGLPERAVVVGDPARVDAIADVLEDSHVLAHQREFRSVHGHWKGVPIVVSSHGVGGPGAQCLFHELAEAGVRRFLRLGTAGALQPQVADGDLVIAEACIRDDGVSGQLIPDTYPAYASPEMVIELARASQQHQAPSHRGVVWTRAAFYPDIVELGLRGYQQAGVLAIEMELATLLVFAARHQLQAAGVLVVDGAAADELRSSSGYDPHREVVTDAISRAITISLDAVSAG